MLLFVLHIFFLKQVEFWTKKTVEIMWKKVAEKTMQKNGSPYGEIYSTVKCRVLNGKNLPSI